MPRSEKQKIKLLMLYEILKKHSDEAHPLTTNKILECLRQEGISCERKTLYADIALLNKYPAFEIHCDKGKGKGKQNQYYVFERDFDDAELRILMDSVQAAAFITKKKTDILCDKLANLAGISKSSLLKRSVASRYAIKHFNEGVLYTVDAIDRAIAEEKKLSFLYFYLGVDGKRKYRNESERYIVNPAGLIFNSGNYYLVGYSDKYKELTSYRVDRMDYTEMQSEKIIEASPYIKEFERSKEQLAAFSMWQGETKLVTLLVHNDLAGDMYDKFGEGAHLVTDGDSHFEIKVNVKISPSFLGWCVLFGNKLKVISPDDVREQVKLHIQETLKQY